MLRKQFSRTGYQDLDQFREHVDNLIDCLSGSGVVDLQPLFFGLTLDTTTAMLLGQSVHSLRAGIDQGIENKIFADSFNFAQEGLAKRFRIAPWHNLYNPQSFRTACHNVHRYVERYIRTSLLSSDTLEKGTRSEFIQQIAEEADDIKDIRDQLLNILLAGRDTTACCLSWTLYVDSKT